MADDVRDVDLTKIHYLTGPFEIEDAEPGDVLVVDIQDVQPLEDSPWGFTGRLPLGIGIVQSAHSKQVSSLRRTVAVSSMKSTRSRMYLTNLDHVPLYKP